MAIKTKHLSTELQTAYMLLNRQQIAIKQLERDNTRIKHELSQLKTSVSRLESLNRG